MRFSNLNKGILAFAIVICGCHNTAKHPPVVEKPAHDAIFNAFFKKDTVHIADSLVLKNSELRLLEANYPDLVKGYPVDPDQDYILAGGKPQDKTDSVFHRFTSEVGRDDYYLIYAYFLKIRNGDKQYQGPRDTLTTIYRTINSINQALHGGGTYYGHQDARIAGYAEYAIYTYAKYKDEFAKPYTIEDQKPLISSLRQMITYAVKNDREAFPEKDKQQKQQELMALTTKLSKLITHYFYLKKAEEFQSGYYK